jgi:nitroreductase
MWSDLVEDARRAPSPHNTQPWLVEAVDDTHARVYSRADRLLPVEDPDYRFLTGGIGIFVEALRVAAAARGLELRDELVGPAGPDALVARVELRRGEPRTDDLRLLLRRRTSRLPYDGRPAPQKALDDLARIAAGFGHVFRSSTDPEFVRWVVELNAATLFYDLAEDDRRKEIRHWTRTSERAARAHADGFSPRCMGFPGWLIRAFFDHHRAVRPVVPLIRRLYLRQLAGTATVGWIAGPWSTPREWYDAGRMLLRLWLAATGRGLVLQPFGSVITNPTAHARLDERLEPSGDPVWLLLRLGYSAEPPESARLPVERVLR